MLKLFFFLLESSKMNSDVWNFLVSNRSFLRIIEKIDFICRFNVVGRV